MKNVSRSITTNKIETVIKNFPTFIPEFRRQREADSYKFEASLVNKVSYRTTRAGTRRNPVLETQ